MEFETCTIPDCPTRGRHAHPVGGPPESYWLRILQKRIEAADFAQKQVTQAMLMLVACRAAKQ